MKETECTGIATTRNSYNVLRCEKKKRKILKQIIQKHKPTLCLYIVTILTICFYILNMPTCVSHNLLYVSLLTIPMQYDRQWQQEINDDIHLLCVMMSRKKEKGKKIKLQHALLIFCIYNGFQFQFSRQFYSNSWNNKISLRSNSCLTHCFLSVFVWKKKRKQYIVRMFCV